MSLLPLDDVLHVRIHSVISAIEDALKHELKIKIKIWAEAFIGIEFHKMKFFFRNASYSNLTIFKLFLKVSHRKCKRQLNTNWIYCPWGRSHFTTIRTTFSLVTTTSCWSTFLLLHSQNLSWWWPFLNISLMIR